MDTRSSCGGHMLKNGKLDLVASRITLINTSSFLTGTWVRQGLQALFLLALVKSLSITEYGYFIGILSIVTVLTPLSGLGADSVMLGEISLDNKNASTYWWGGQILILISAPPLILISLLLNYIFLYNTQTDALAAGAVLAISELVFGKSSELCGRYFQSTNRLWKTSQIRVSLTLTRLILVLPLWLFEKASLTFVAISYLSASIITCSLAWLHCRSEIIFPASLPSIYQLAKRGLGFCLYDVVDRVQNDGNKPLALALLGPEQTACLSIAQRIVDLAFSPVSAMLADIYPKLFKDPMRAKLPSIRALLHYYTNLSFASAACVGLVLVGGALVPLLPSSYSPAQKLVLLLFPMPALMMMQHLLGKIIASLNQQNSGAAALIASTALGLFIQAAAMHLLPFSAIAPSIISAELIIVASLYFTYRQICQRL